MVVGGGDVASDARAYRGSCLARMVTGPRTIRFELPFATPSQNVLQKWHWSRRSKLRDDVQMLIRCQMRSPLTPIKVKMGVEVTRMGARELDYGNLVGGCKPVIDAIVREGLLYDDSPTWLIEDYRQLRVAKDAERTVILVYPIA